MKWFLSILWLVTLTMPAMAQATIPHRGIWIVAEDNNRLALGINAPGNNEHLGTPLMKGIINAPFIDGFTLNILWPNLETARGVYDWSVIDIPLAIAQQHNKRIVLDIRQSGLPGTWTPQWVYDAGVSYLSMPNWVNASECLQTLEIPLPWDANYQAILNELITAIGNRYDGIIEGIHFIGAGSDTEEQGFPTNNSNTSITCSSGPNAGVTAQVPNLDAIWAAAGYTATAYHNAMEAIAGYFSVAFPNTNVIMSVLADNSNSPSIDVNGNIVPQFTGSKLNQGFYFATNATIADIGALGYAILGDRWSIQYNDLRGSVPWQTAAPGVANGTTLAASRIPPSLQDVLYYKNHGIGGAGTQFSEPVTNGVPPSSVGCSMNDYVTPCTFTPTLQSALSTATAVGNFTEGFPGDVDPTICCVWQLAYAAFWQGIKN